MTVASRNLQVITGRAAREGARERVCFAQKPIAATKKWLCEQPNNLGAAALHLVPRGIDRAKCLISLNATGETKTLLSTVGRGGARRPRPSGEVAIGPAPARNAGCGGPAPLRR